jgi:DnaK suppressor protein
MARKDLIAKMKKILEEKRDRLRGTLSGMSHQSQQEVYRGDMADQAVSTIDRELNATLTETGSNELSQVNEALMRIEQGTYGICIGCGKQIPTARLQALPFVSRCVGCQEEAERNGDTVIFQTPIELADVDIFDQDPADGVTSISLQEIEADAN